MVLLLHLFNRLSGLFKRRRDSFTHARPDSYPVAINVFLGSEKIGARLWRARCHGKGRNKNGGR